MDEKTSEEHLAWLVKHRSQNQDASLRLYGLLKKHEKKIRTNEGLMLTAQMLVAINFSLWRAVFLADKEDGADKRLQHAEDFLVKLIVDNAVGYPLERTSRNWTFGYYINNAGYRLKELAKARPDILSDAWERQPRKTSKENWIVMQKALIGATKNFAAKLKGKVKKL